MVVSPSRGPHVDVPEPASPANRPGKESSPGRLPRLPNDYREQNEEVASDENMGEEFGPQSDEDYVEEEAEFEEAKEMTNKKMAAMGLFGMQI